MTAEASISLVYRYISEVWQQRNIAAIEQFLHPNYKRYSSPIAIPMTIDEQKARVAGFRTAFPDVQLTIEDIFSSGDRVAFRSTIRGTHEGMFMGIAPTHRVVVVALLDIMRIENESIIEHWGGPDLLNLLQQLGAAISLPAATS
jgi:predicted ester cyclase